MSEPTPVAKIGFSIFCTGLIVGMLLVFLGLSKTNHLNFNKTPTPCVSVSTK